MKSIFKILILVSMILLLSNSICMANDWDVRPVKLKVVDAATKQPLPGIKVYYVLTTWYPDMSCVGYFFYPTFIHDASRINKNVVKWELTTNENGEATFGSKTLTMQCYETILWEHIAINLDVDMNRPWIKSTFKDRHEFFGYWMYVFGEEELFNINKSYRGFFLTYVYKQSSHEEDLVKDPDYRQVYEKHKLKKLDALRRATDWEGPPEEYTVELRRAD
jgi:hypothetical protein